MTAYPESLQNLIKHFSKLPGVGKKTAERLSIYILNANTDQVLDFSKSLKYLKDRIEDL